MDEIHRNYRALAMGAALAIVSLVASQACAAGKDLLSAVPADSHLVVLADDVSEACVEFTRTSIGQEFTGKPFDPLVKELHKRDQAGPLHLKPWFGIDWPELIGTRCPGALVVFPLQPGKPGAALIFEADQQQNVDLLNTAGKYFEGKGWKRRVQKNAKGTWTIFESAKPAATRVFVECDAFSGMTNSLSAAERLLKVEENLSLASEKDAKAWLAHESEAKPGDARFFCRPLLLWKSLHVPPPGKKGLRDSLNRAERLGVGGIAAAGGRIAWDRARSNNWTLHADLRMNEPYSGALQALAMLPGKAMATPASIPAEVTSVTSWRWDFKVGLRAIAAIFDEMEDPGPNGVGLFDQILDGLIEDPEGPKVDLRTDFFHKLGPEVTLIRDELPRAGKQPLPRMMLVAECADPKGVHATLAKFFKGDADVIASKAGDNEVWTAKPGKALFVAGENAREGSDIRAVAIGEQRVLLATDPVMLTAALDAKGPAKPLVKSAEWEAFAAWEARQRSDKSALSAWVRPSRALASSYEQATRPLVAKEKEEDTFSTQMWLFLLYGTTDRSADLPYKVVPKFDAWSASLSPLGLVLSRTEGGNALTLGAPQPPMP